MHASLYSKDEIDNRSLFSFCDYWTKTKLENGYRYELALLKKSHSAFADVIEPCLWYEIISEHLALGSSFQCLAKPQAINAVSVAEDDLAIALFIDSIANSDTAVSSAPIERHEECAWVNSLLSKEAIALEDIASLLRRDISAEFTEGRLICSCFQVREKSIITAIKAGDDSVQKLGAKLKCGTNCGSCRSELASLIKDHKSESKIAEKRTDDVIPVMQLEASL
ncbi:bacterioferritin-associated ferredoxin [Glaciecola sp. MH2013]|uniref:(2Fe-2S)-binding protein n=1 Tax=Glaciecola sp. MH2013 TaxID=2785524 RepID=UPI00351C52E9